MKRFKWFTVLAPWVAGLGITLGVAAQTYAGTCNSAANDFSLAGNPNGVWGYGYTNSLGAGLLSLYDVATPNARGAVGLDSWTASIIGVDPHVIHNSTPSPITFGGSVTVPAHGLQFHPGPDEQFSVIRWSAPAAGAYKLDVAFRGNDFIGPTSTDVHVLGNNLPLFNSNVTAYGPGPSFTTIVSVSAGDTIDFVVGVGLNNNYSFDSTGIEATICAVCLAGMPGKPNCHGKCISALAQEFGGLDAAASALGFPSVQALQDAIGDFCAP
jgi:hypothetical protein